MLTKSVKTLDIETQRIKEMSAHTHTHLAKEKNEKRENKMIKIQANFSSFNWKKERKKNVLLIE